MKNTRKKVFVALSGGVDSAVSAALLKEQGYEVAGVFMKNWSGDNYGIQADCPWEKDQADALEVCQYLDIPFKSFNFEKQYREKVVEYFFNEYRNGRTPNPDIMCNKEIKFKLFLEKAMDEGVDLIATGHYARVKKDKNGFHLYKGVDLNKNQVYFLYNLNQEQLSKTLFPIGHLDKSEVREFAKKLGLPNYNKPDSQGICFIGEINVLKFLMSRIPKKEGQIIDIDTKKEVGIHNGIYFYTIGQRAKIPNQKEAYYYCKKDIKNNIMLVCQGRDHSALMRKEVNFTDFHWVTNRPLKKNLKAVIRYRQKPGKGVLDIKNSKFIFNRKQRGIASGQSVVVFNKDECLGGGIIL